MFEMVNFTCRLLNFKSYTLLKLKTHFLVHGFSKNASKLLCKFFNLNSNLKLSLKL